MAHRLVGRAALVRERARGGNVLTPACIERVNGIVRERLASRHVHTRRHAASRVQALHTGMSLRGCALVHQKRSKETHWGKACTPAMTSGLTDPVWNVGALRSNNVAPAPWREPIRHGRPPTHTGTHRSNERAEPSSVLSTSRSLAQGGFCSATDSYGFACRKVYDLKR